MRRSRIRRRSYREPTWSSCAIAGLVLAVVCPPLGIVVSFVGLADTVNPNRRGHELALAGLLVSTVSTLLIVLYVGGAFLA